MLDLDAPAELYRLEEQPDENYEIDLMDIGNLVHSGTITHCVKKVMAAPESERVRYSMKVEQDRFCIPDRSYHDGLIFCYDWIKAQYERPDFPKR
jgi:hypothetical protein